MATSIFAPRQEQVTRKRCAQCGSSVPDGNQDTPGYWRCNMCLSLSEGTVTAPRGPLIWRLILAICANGTQRIGAVFQALKDWVRSQEIRDEIEALEEERRVFGAHVPAAVNGSTLIRLGELNPEISVIDSRRILRLAQRYSIKVNFETEASWNMEHQGYILTQDEYRRLRTLIRSERREKLKALFPLWASVLTFLGTLLSVYLGWRLRR